MNLYIIKYAILKILNTVLFFFKTNTKNKKNILFISNGGFRRLIEFESLIGLYLKFRGHNVKSVICDCSYKACIQRSYDNDKCSGCFLTAKNVLEKLDLSYIFGNSLLNDKDKKLIEKKFKNINWKKIDKYKVLGTGIGVNIKSGVLRFFLGQTNLKSKYHWNVLERYSKATISNLLIARKVFKKFKPDLIFSSHMIYSDFGPFIQLARKKKIRVITWNRGYLKNRIFLSNLNSKMKFRNYNLNKKTLKKIFSKSLNKEKIKNLNNFYTSRLHNFVGRDFKIKFKVTNNKENTLKKLKIQNSEKKIWGILTPINWDAVGEFDNLYSNLNLWFVDLIKFASKNKNLIWVIRFHPSEKIFSKKNNFQSMLKQSNLKLPINIKLNYPEDQVSSKDFYDIIDGAVVYRSTSGLELLYQRKNIITCGLPHYGFHGFTRDASTKRQLQNLIKTAHTLKPLSNYNYQKITKYCYYFFISRQIEFKIMNDKYSDWYKLNYFKIPWYFLNKNKELNLVLKGIEKNIDFINFDK